MSQIFRLERFYFGTLVDQSKQAVGTPGVIARTTGVSRAQVAECLRLAPCVPPHADESSDTMPGTLGLFRGETTEFILSKAQLNDAGLPQLLYILVPLAALRQLGGNVLALRPLGMMDMPSFTAIKQNLMPFELRDPAPLTAQEQTDALLDLLLYCQDSFKNVEGILAGLIQGMPIAIVNSPPSLDQRLRFIQGLLSLLPVPARLGITFATQVNDAAVSPAQLKFMSERAEPPNHLVYDWGKGKLLTPPPDDSYSRYMLAQLRLDPSLVIEQTEKLSRTTVWRAMHKENLSSALKWVSRRAALDQTVMDGQPADRETVAAILREDPTLSDELRLAYTRHLLAFALALNDPESADLVPAVAVTNAEIAQAVADQLRVAIENGQARVVHTLLERWLLRVPETAALNWQPILHNAARQHFSDLLRANDLQAAMAYFKTLRSAPAALRFNDAMPDFAAVMQEPARSDPAMARELFLMAVDALPPGELFRLLSDAGFTRQLPPPTQTALKYLEPEPRRPAPPHVLDAGARVFGDGQRMIVLARFVEWAMYLQRTELIDTNGLQALLVIAQSPQADRFLTLIQHVVDDFSQLSMLQMLEPPGPRVLIQLLLQTGQYDQAVGLLEFYQSTLFGPARLDEFTRLAGDAFLLTPLTPDDLTTALEHLEGSQLRPEPRAMILCSVLANRQWSEDQDYAARRLTTMIFNDSGLIATIGQENVLRLLGFFARSRHALDALRVGAALVDHIVDRGQQGAVMLTRLWPLVTWDDEVREAAVELLRRFIRGVKLTEIPIVIEYFRETLGESIAEALRATALMRLVMGESGVMRFAEDIHIATQLLVDLATTYHTNKERPPKHRLRRDLDTMTGGLTEDERKCVVEYTLNITRLVYELGRSRTRKRGKPPIEEQLVQGAAAPQNGVDLLRFIGGHFAQQRVLSLNLEREAMAHIFGNRSAAMFLRETKVIARRLDELQNAFRDPRLVAVSAQALSSELDSLWGTLSLYNQRRLQEQFAADCQHLAEVISLLSDQGSDRILSPGGLGRQLETGQHLPQTALEALRWINGYFARKHN